MRQQLQALGRALKHKLQLYQLVLADQRTPRLARWYTVWL
jgi:hypothetical protein